MVRDSRHRARTLRIGEDDPDRLQTVLEFAHKNQLEDTRGVADELERLAEQAQSATMGAGAAIAVLRQNQMECIARSGAVAPQLGSRAEVAAGLCGECVRTGLPQFCTDTEIDPRVNRVDARSFGARSIGYVPLFRGSQPAGVLGVFSNEKSHFSTRDLRVLASIGRDVTRTLHWHAKPDTVMTAARANTPQSGVAPAMQQFGGGYTPGAGASAIVPQQQPSETPQALELKTNFAGPKPRAKPGDVLTFPVAEEPNPLLSGSFAALLTVLILAGTGIGYLAVLWTQGNSSGRTISQSASTSASPATTPVAKSTRGVNPAAQPSEAPTMKAVSVANNSSKTTKVAAPVGPIYLESVRTQVLAGRTLVSLHLNENAQYQVHTLTNPDRIYVDLENARLKDSSSSVPTRAAGGVRAFRVGAKDNKVRVVMELMSPCTYVVRTTKNPTTIVLDILSDSLAEQ